MRVIYVVSLFPCWSETFIVREIRELLRMGVDVRIVSLRHPSETLVQSDARELQDRVIYPAPVLRTAVAAASAVLRHPLRELGRLFEIGWSMSAPPIERLKSLGAWWRITGLSAAMRKFDPDLLHAHWATYPSTAAMIAAERLERPFSFTCHAHDIFTADHLLRRKLRRCAFGVTISDFNRRYLAQRIPNAGAERLRVVHCGIEPDVMPFHDGGRQSDPPLVLAVGRLDPIKGFADLVDACRDLRDRGMTFQCDIVGDGPLRAELQQRIDAAGLSAAVRLRGACKQEEVRALMDRATIFVLPSVVTPQGDRDGIPVALMEAMASGAPVVSTRVSGIPELVEDGDCGLLVEPHDPESLASAMRRLLSDPDLRSRFARAARRKVEADFDVTRETHKLFQEMEHAVSPSASASKSHPIRVLFITDEMEIGGTQRQIVHIATGLDRRQCESAVAYFRHRSFLCDELEQAGVPVIPIPKAGKIDFRFLAGLSRKIREGNFDVVHCFSFTGEFWGALACSLIPLRHRPALITSVRNTYDWYTPWQWAAKSWAGRQSQAIVSNSRIGAQYAAGRMKRDPSDIEVIYNGVSLSQAALTADPEDIRSDLGMPDDAVFVLFVGRLVEQKNVSLLLRATARCVTAGTRVSLGIAGDGPLRADLESEVDAIGIRSSVRFFGHRPDAHRLIRSSDLVVLPSVREGLSNVVMESMLAGKPVIVSAVGGNGELIDDGVSGILFPSGDVDALAAAITRLASSPALRCEMGAAGKYKASTQFSVGEMVRRYQTRYADLATRTRPTSGVRSALL